LKIMKEAVEPIIPLDIQQKAKDAAHEFLNSNVDLLHALWEAPSTVEARKSMEAFMPGAEEIFLKAGVSRDIGKRALIDASIRRWAELHPTEKLPEQKT